jgi:AcrR family transcriptional regulator
MTAPKRATRSRRPPTTDASEQATRRAVIDAAVASILERGFYRASSNEITRRAGVTWGVIQHYFGTRESLMLAVLEDGARRFDQVVEGGVIDGDTVAERVAQLLDVLAEHYGTQDYLAYMQIALNMDHDPTTSAEVRATLQQVARRSADQLRALIRATLGPATSVPDLATTIFLTLRGFVVSQLLLDTMTYDTVVPESDRVERQRRLLGKMLAPYLEEVVRNAER